MVIMAYGGDADSVHPTFVSSAGRSKQQRRQIQFQGMACCEVGQGLEMDLNPSPRSTRHNSFDIYIYIYISNYIHHHIYTYIYPTPRCDVETQEVAADIISIMIRLRTGIQLSKCSCSKHTSWGVILTRVNWLVFLDVQMVLLEWVVFFSAVPVPASWSSPCANRWCVPFAQY